MDYFDIHVDNNIFYGFANEFKGDIELDQFERINDTTISWIKHPHLYNNSIPNVFIKLVFNENNVPVFELFVKFSENIVCFQSFKTATDAINYLNNAINSARIHKRYRDEIWSRYGF